MKYRVEFPYYHYNTGRADNGWFTGSCHVDTFLEAETMAASINQAYQFHHKQSYSTEYIDTPESVELIQDQLLSGDGYFTGEASIYEVSEKQIQ